MFDNPEVRFAVLDQVINDRLLAAKARDERFRISDAQLRDTIASIPAFQDGGKFSGERYEMFLIGQNTNRIAFEEKVRQDMLAAAVQEPVAAANIVARPSTEKFLGLLEQQREVATAVVDAAPFVKDVKVDDAAVKAFYEKNQAAFQTPELAKIEYLILTADALLAGATVDPADVKKQYDANLQQYSKRRGTQRGAHPDRREAGRQRRRPRSGEEAGRRTAGQGEGQPGEVRRSGPRILEGPGLGAAGRRPRHVRARHDGQGIRGRGFRRQARRHRGTRCRRSSAGTSSRSTASTAGHVQPFDEVKAQIEADLKRQQAAQKFAASADQFQNLVYEQADGLAGAAKALNLKVEVTPFITRAQAQAIAKGNAKFVQALFAPESIQGKRNTEAIEIGPNTLIAARIIDYKAAAPRPFDEIKDELRHQLVRKAASDLAQEAGRAKLALLNEGKTDKQAGVTFGKPVQLGRNQPQAGIAPDAVARIFEASQDKLPAYVGATNERGDFSIYRLLSVIDAIDGRQGQGGRRVGAARRAGRTRNADRLSRDAEGEGGRQDQPGQPGKEIGARGTAAKRKRRPAGRRCPFAGRISPLGVPPANPAGSCP